jgi:DNA replication initiation complex subunit (GINS family)
MLAEEKQFYNELVAMINGARKTIFEKTQTQSAPPVEKKSSPSENPPEEKNKNPLVRVTVDIPAFVGPDMKTYLLKKQDILSLPKEIAEPLGKRGVVQPLK